MPQDKCLHARINVTFISSYTQKDLSNLFYIFFMKLEAVSYLLPLPSYKNHSSLNQLQYK